MVKLSTVGWTVWYAVGLWLLTAGLSYALAQQVLTQRVLTQPPEHRQTPSRSGSNHDADSSCRTLFEPNQLYHFSQLRKLQSQAIGGRTIGQINIYSLAIFDESNPREDSYLYSLLNRIHVKTQPHVLASQLLFSSGDQLDIRLLEESERILRQKKYIADALIVPERICDEQIDLAVVTRDNWTLQPSMSFSREGGESDSGLSIQDKNLLGTGNDASISYSNAGTQDKIVYQFATPHLFNSRWNSSLQYADSSDGEEVAVSLQRPFYSLDTRWSGGFQLEETSQQETIKFNSRPDLEFIKNVSFLRGFYGISDGLKSNFAERWLAGVQLQDTTFEATPKTTDKLPGNRYNRFVWFAFQQVEDKFQTFNNIHKIHKIEDISLGRNSYLELGYGDKAMNNANRFLHYYGVYQDALAFGDHHLATLASSLSGRWLLDEQQIESSLLSNTLSYHHFITNNKRWFARLRFDIGKALSEDELLTFAADDALRGYPNDVQTGNRRLLLNVEWRHFSNIHLFNLFRLGSVVFIDSGRAWQDGHFDDSAQLLDVGAGLRLSSSKSHMDHLLHLDFSVPLTETETISDYQVTIKTRKNF